MKKVYFRQIIKNNIQMLLIGIVFLLTPAIMVAQSSYYIGNAGDTIASSNSRMVISIEETESYVMLDVMALGEVLADGFSFAMVYDSTSLILTDNTLTYEVPLGYDPADLGSGVITMDPLFASAYKYSSISAMNHFAVESGDGVGMKYIVTGIGITNQNKSAAINVEAGKMIPVYTVYFKKRVSGKPLRITDLGFYYNTTIVRTYSSWNFSGVSVTYGATGSSDFHYPNPDLFVYRSPSTVTTHPANNVAATSVTLNAHLSRGEFGTADSMIVSGKTSATKTGRFNYDTITQYGFIYSMTDVELTSDNLSDKLVIDGIDYNFPDALELAAGLFERGGDTLYIIFKNNQIADQTRDYDENITGLIEDTTYYVWAVMKYAFETSDIYVNVGAKETFQTMSTCISPDRPITLLNQSFCGDATVADLIAFVPDTLDLVWYTDANVMLDPSDPLVDGASYYAKASDEGCESDSVKVTVTLNGGLNAPTAKSPQMFCIGSHVSDLLAAGIGITWYDASTGGIVVSETEELVDGQIYYAVQNDGVCESGIRTAVKAIIRDNIVIDPPVVISPQDFCDSATLNDIATDGSNIVWYNANGAILPANTRLVNGTTYYAAKNTGACESTIRTPVVVTTGNNLIDPPIVTSPQHFCNGATLENISVGNNHIIWYASLTENTPLASRTVLADNVTYYAVQKAGNCESTTRTPVLIIIDEASDVIAEANQVVCYGSTIADITITGAGIKWYDSPVAGTELSMSTLLVDGNTYYAVQSATNCEGTNRIGVTITIRNLGTPTVLSPQYFCSPATVADLQATGTGIIWYDNATAGTQLDVNTALVDGQKYYAAQTSGLCESTARVAVEVAFQGVPVVTNVQNFVFCNTDTVPVFKFEGIPDDTVVSFRWKRIIGHDLGLVQTSGNDTIPAFIAKNTGIYPLIATYEVTPVSKTNSGLCYGTSEKFLITVNPAPAISGVTDMVYCSGTVVNAYTFTGNVADASYKWYRTGGDSIPGLSREGYSILPGFTATADTTILKAYYKVAANYEYANIACNIATDTVEFSITVNPVPKIKNVHIPDFVFCSGEDVNGIDIESLVAYPNNPIGTEYEWELVSGSYIGIPTNSGINTIAAFKAENEGSSQIINTYVVKAIFGNCESVQKQTVRIVVNPGPFLNSATYAEICSGNSFQYTATTTSAGTTFSWTRQANPAINDGGTSSGKNAVIDEVLVNNSDTTASVIYEFELQNGSCQSSQQQVEVVVKPIPEINMVSRQTVCFGETSIDLSYTISQNIPMTYNLVFSDEALIAGFQNQTQFIQLPVDKITIKIPAAAKGVYQGTVNIKNSYCTTSYPFEIKIEEPFAITQQPVSVDNLCDTTAIVVLSVVANANNLNYQWFYEGTAINGTNSAIYSFDYDSGLSGEYYVEVSNSCMTLTSAKVTVRKSTLTVEMKWDDVIYVSDPGHRFSSFQWYKDGQPIMEDGYAQYYGEEAGFSGTYYVRCYYPDGSYIESCPKTLSTRKMTKMVLYPNPVGAGSSVFLEIQTNEFDVEDASLEIFDATGKLINRSIISDAITEITAPMAAGVYTAKIVTKTKQTLVKRFIVSQ